MGGTKDDKKLTMVCIASNDDVAYARNALSSSGVRVGGMRSDGNDIGSVLSRLNGKLAKNGKAVDAVVISQSYVSAKTGTPNTAVQECVLLGKHGIAKDTLIGLVDESRSLNAKGVKALSGVGIHITNDMQACVNDVRKTLGLKEPEPADDGKPITEQSIPFGDHSIPDANIDPFSSIRDSDGTDDGSQYDDVIKSLPVDHDDFDDPFDDDDDDAADFDDSTDEGTIDPFAALDDGDSGDGANATGDDVIADIGDIADDDIDIDIPWSDNGGGVGDWNDDSAGLASLDDDDAINRQSVDEAHRYDGFSGNGTAEDIENVIAPAITYGNPKWDYSEVNEGIRENSGFLSKLKGNGGGRIGEADNRMQYANSLYIRNCSQTYGGYDPPENCKIVTCYSNVGGSGKTTISTMIGAQLVWDFDRDLLERRSSNMPYRILVLSLNEFDDISVKGIGNSRGQQSLLESNSGRDILALKQKIDELGDNLTWDDIAPCFKFSPTNYVMYVPSMTLKEKFQTGLEITDKDYQRILTQCKRFFNFIIIDTPDVLYNNRFGLIQFAMSIADVLCLIMTPDAKSTYNMYNLIDGLKASTPNGKLPFSREQTMLVVNKVATNGNPYIGHTNGQQIPFKSIANAYTKLFFKVLPVPLSDQTMSENVMFGYDKKVKEAASDITDTVLEMIDRHDKTNGFKVQASATS